MLNPWRLYRRHQRLERHALEEARLLRRRYGRHALNVAQEKLARADLTQWGRKVLRRAIARLRRDV